jgi:putative oxidoreductase
MTRFAISGVQIVVALSFIGMGIAKLAGADLMVLQFELIGLGPWFRLFVGAIEILGGLLLLVPRTAVLGAVLATSVMMIATGAVIAQSARPGVTTERVTAPKFTSHRAYDI